MRTAPTLACSRKTCRWGWRTVLVVTGLLLLLVWGWWKSRNATLRIDDTLVIQVAGVTMGTNHVAPGQFFRRWHKRLPPRFQKWVETVVPDSRLPLHTFSPLVPQPMLWFRPLGPTRTPGYFPRNPSPNLPGPYLSFVDEQGLRVGILGLVEFSGSSPPWPMDFSVYPRRQRHWDLVLLKSQEPIPDGSPPRFSLAVAGRLRVRNPQPFTGGHWTPEPLPALRSTNGLDLSVEDLVVRRYQDTNMHAPEWIRLSTELRLGRDFARPEVNQRILDVRLIDPTGNKLGLFPKRAAGTESNASSETIFHTPASLFSDEPAWRVQLDLLPGPEEGRTEPIHFTNVAFPPRVRSVHGSVLVPGLVISIVGVMASAFDDLNLLQVDFVSNTQESDLRVRVLRARDAAGNTWRAEPHSFEDFQRLESNGEWRTLTSLVAAGKPDNVVGPVEVWMEVVRPHRLTFDLPPRFDEPPSKDPGQD